MDELTKLTDQQLHHKMFATSQAERELTAQMISMIEEANKRKFYLDLGFGTLFDYLTIGLKYSAASAMRRIPAARIAEEIPEVKDRVLDGSLSLSNLSQAEKFFRNERKNDHVLNADEKKSVLKQLENKSSRDAEKTLLQMSCAPEQLQPEKMKAITPELTRITFNADSEFMDQLEEARGLIAHRLPNATVAEVLAEIMKTGLAGLKKKKFKVDTSKEAPIESQLEPSQEWVDPEPEELRAPQVENASDAGSKNSSFISASVRREVFQRDRGRCVVVNPVTGRPCSSRRQLELDHFPTPRAMGGPPTVANLRVACRRCNLLHAVQSYGRNHILKKMAPFK